MDRIYLNGYVPNLQVAGQVVRFLTGHLGRPVPSPTLTRRTCVETVAGSGHTMISIDGGKFLSNDIHGKEDLH